MIPNVAVPQIAIKPPEPNRGGEVWTIPLWEARWGQDALLRRRRDIGERAFDRGFRQRALSDKERTFPALDRCVTRGLDVIALVDPEWPRYIGVDPSGEHRKGTCLFVLARAPNGARYLLDVRYGAWKPERIADEVITLNAIHHPVAIYFENNALQDAFIALVKLRGALDIPIRGFLTGKQKADPMVGLPSLEIELENAAWVIGEPEHETGCQCDVHHWLAEVRNHPVYGSEDGVMAWWFAREASKVQGLPPGSSTHLPQPSRWHGAGSSPPGGSRWRRSGR